MTPVPEGFEPVTVVPAIPAFEFRFLLPRGWQQVEVPQGQPDFNDPKLFMPLGVFVDQATASIFSVAGRPGYGDGTVLQWLQFLARENGFVAEEYAPFQLQAVQGAMVLATQPNEGGTTRLRCVAVEDGGNFFTVTAMTPVEHWDKLQPTLDLMLHSFFLRNLKGPTVPLAPEDQSTSGKTCKDFALADDAAALDPQHEMNQRFVNSGVGLVPRVLATNDAEKCATVGATAIMASFNVPYGWHVIDDTRRTLVFDAQNQIQVNFNLLDPGQQSVDEIFTDILKDLVQENPEALYNRMMLEDMPAMIVKGLTINGEKLEQGYFLKPLAHKPGCFLKTRITTTAEHITRAGDLFEVLLKEMKFFA